MNNIVSFNQGPSGVLSDVFSASTTGVFEFIEYSSDGVTYGPNPTTNGFPDTSYVWDDTEDLSEVVAGYYKFRYRANLAGGSPCYDEVEFIIRVMDGSSTRRRTFRFTDVIDSFVTIPSAPAGVDIIEATFESRLASFDVYVGKQGGKLRYSQIDTGDSFTRATYKVNHSNNRVEFGDALRTEDVEVVFTYNLIPV